jgi:hypothetical protein
LVDFLRLTDEVSEADKRLLFGASLRDWFDWDAAVPAAASTGWTRR